MSPTQLTVLMGILAAVLGVGVAIGVRVWVSGQIRRLHMTLADSEAAQNIMQDRYNDLGEQMEKIHRDLASSCEFMRGEYATSEGTLQKYVGDLAEQLRNLEREFHESQNSILLTLSELSENHSQTMQYFEHSIGETRGLLEGAKADFAAAISAQDRESQTRDQELNRIVTELDERLSNTITTRFKQLKDKFDVVESQTRSNLEKAQNTFSQQISDFINQTKDNLAAMKSEMEKEITATRDYIEDSLREHRRDLMV